MPSFTNPSNLPGLLLLSKFRGLKSVKIEGNVPPVAAFLSAMTQPKKKESVWQPVSTRAQLLQKDVCRVKARMKKAGMTNQGMADMQSALGDGPNKRQRTPEPQSAVSDKPADGGFEGHAPGYHLESANWTKMGEEQRWAEGRRTSLSLNMAERRQSLSRRLVVPSVLDLRTFQSKCHPPVACRPLKDVS